MIPTPTTTTRRCIVSLVLLVSAIALNPAPVAAQTADGAAATPADADVRATIDSTTDLLSVDYDGHRGVLVLEVRTDEPTALTITDAGAFSAGGEMARRTEIVDGTATIEMPVTKVEGLVGVTISTPETLYAVPVRVSFQLWQGTPTWNEVHLSALGGVVGGLGAAVLIARRKRDRDTEEIRRTL